MNDFFRLSFLIERKEPSDDGHAHEGDTQVQVVVRRVLEGRGSKCVRREAEDRAWPQDQGESTEDAVDEIDEFRFAMTFFQFIDTMTFPALLHGLRGHPRFQVGLVALAEDGDVDIVSVEVDVLS